MALSLRSSIASVTNEPRVNAQESFAVPASRIRKKGLSALVILSDYLGIITNAAIAVIILVISFAISNQPIAREIVTAARASITPDAVDLMPFIGHSLSFECSRFSQTSSPPRTKPDPRNGQLTTGEK